MVSIRIETARRDSDLPSRLAYLDVKSDLNSKRVITPRRSLCLTMLPYAESRRIANPKVRGINEIPRRLTKETVLEIDSDIKKQEEFYSDIERRFHAVNPSEEVNVFLYSYENGNRKSKPKEPNHMPTEAETEYLCGLLNHPFNDIWVPPVVPDLSGRDYLPYLEHFYEYVNTNHRVGVAGLIPHVSSLDIRRIAEIYVKRGLNYFVMDFAGKNPFAMYGNIVQTREILRGIERQTGLPCFLHGINVPFYRGFWEDKILLARDILLFGLGFDCFGSNHIYRPRFLTPEEKEKLKAKPRRYRLFNRKDYGYYRDDVIKAKDFEETESTYLTVQDFRPNLEKALKGAYETLFNVERHGLEADEIRTKLIEGESLRKHLGSKLQLTPVVLNRILGSPATDA